MILTEQEIDKFTPLTVDSNLKLLTEYLEKVKNTIADVRTAMPGIKEEHQNDIRLGVCQVIDSEILEILEQLASGKYEKPEDDWR